MRVTRRRMSLAALAAVALAAGGYALRPKPVEVETALATREPMRVTIDAEGRTSVRDRFTLAAPVAGRVRRLAVREGDRVVPGQVLAWIAPLPLDASAHEQAEARLVAAQAAARETSVRIGQARVAEDDARRVVARRQAVFAVGGISREELDQVVLAHRARVDDLAAAEARATAAGAEIAAARAALVGGTAALPIRAPAPGVVLRVPERSERVIPAGTPLLELGDSRALEVTTDVLSADAVLVRPGDAAEIVEWGRDSALRASVRLVEPSAFTRVSALGVDEQRVNVRLDMLDAPRELGDGFRVEVRITVWERPDVLSVPASALFRRGREWAVFVVEDGRARARVVEAGHRTSAAVEIRRGLDAGARVILFPSDQVAEATRVRLAGG